MTQETSSDIPNAFIWRRLHSLVGLGLVLFLIEHLVTNSQAGLMFGEDGRGFIGSVNWLHGLPFLQVIEVTFLGAPFLIHTLWGIKYLRTAKPNSFYGSGKKPTLHQYSRNHAYTWQRAYSWLLIIAIGWHVWEMRFEHQPAHATRGLSDVYVMKVSLDDGLYTVSERLSVQLYDQQMIAQEEKRIAVKLLQSEQEESQLLASVNPARYDPERGKKLVQESRKAEEHNWLEALKHKSLKDGQVMAVAPDFGTAILLMVRDTMKSPIKCLLYTFLVIAAVYHAFNGLWTWTITWGIAVTPASQLLLHRASRGLMVLFTFLGLSAVWLTYWINLRQ